MKKVSIGVEGFDVKIAEHHHHFPHLIEQFATPAESYTTEVKHYFNNRTVAMLHVKVYDSDNTINIKALQDHLVAHGWSTTDPDRKFVTLIYTHPQQYGHEICITRSLVGFYVQDRYAVLPN